MRQLPMDLRQHISNEISALAERLIAASETELKRTQQESSEKYERLQQELSSVRDALHAETARAQELAARLDAESDHAGTLNAQLDTETLRTEKLTAQLEAETIRAGTLTTQLEAETIRAGTLTTQLEAETIRAGTLTTQLEAETTRARTLTSALEAESNRASALAEQLETQDARIAALATELQAGRMNAAALSAELDTEKFRAAALASELGTEKTRATALLDADASQREAVTTAEATIRELREQLAQQSASITASDARAQAAEEARARMDRQIGEAHALTDATSAEMSALTRRFARMVALLNRAAASLVTLSMTNTTKDLIEALVRELAREFERVAIFRLEGNHLEGEHAAGLDLAIDIHKIVVPMGLKSVMTRAATTGTIEHAAEKEIGEGRPPFGGSPASALAAPLVCDGDVLAVAYLESDTKFSDAHAPLAAILVRHANAVIAGLAQELKTSRNLRDYARTLLNEAAAMFETDVQAAVPDKDRLTRLSDSIRFARDLYMQRAALESPLSMNLLDEEIGRMLRESSTPFTAALATTVDKTGASRGAATA